MVQWLLSDLHIHTTFSDGEVPLLEVIELYGGAGFDVIAITDHLFDTQSPIGIQLRRDGKSVGNLRAYFESLREAARFAMEQYGMLVLPGLEICNINEDYHILGIDLQEGVDPDQGAMGVIDEIHRQGGLAIASHPQVKLSYFLQGDHVAIQRHPLHLWTHREDYREKIDAWEVANREDLYGTVVLDRLRHVANSDFHERRHMTAWRSLIEADKDAGSIKRAIRNGKVSLFFFQGETPALSPLQTFHNPVIVEENPPVDGAKGNVLIADDERDLVEMIGHNLRKRGYQVFSAHTGYEAWEQLNSNNPDLVILDLMMPELDGWELCRLIRQSPSVEIRETGILMLTARAMEDEKIHGLTLGADDYMTKPFSLKELILRVEKLVGKGREVRRAREEANRLHSCLAEKESGLRKVAHDLKNPLISIGASAMRMLRRTQCEEQQRILGSIHDSSLRLTNWIEEVLVPAGPAGEKGKKTDIRPLVEQAIEMFREASRPKNIELRLEASPVLPGVACHEQLLLRALTNLLSNAVKYTPAGGSVDVSLHSYLEWRDGGVVEISIRDTGIGIPPHEIERIFEPHYRASNVSEEEGLGAGLSFVKEIVDLHGGKILVQSELQKGSTFTLLIPVKVGGETMAGAGEPNRNASPW